MESKDYDLNMQLNEVYERLADISQRQRELNKERSQVERTRDEILRELGRAGVYGVNTDEVF
jgi:predicted transcriptional regulator